MLATLFYHVSFCFCYLLIYTFLIPAVITQIFNPIVELAIRIEIPTKEAKAEIETHPAIVETKISECSILFKILKTFYASY